jgi:putative mRNA 3-end processing factor
MYVPLADVYIDPFKAVENAIITHAHGDHARRGNINYLCHSQSVPILKRRIGHYLYQSAEYGEIVNINCVKFSFHPAGHVLGSAQIRVENKGEIWVVSGDYKTEDDGIVAPFEAIKCHTFITESTFGLPEFDWLPQEEIFSQINEWWQKNADENKCSVIYAYSLGKAQRVIQYLKHQIGPVFVHGSIQNMNEAYREAGVLLKSTRKAGSDVDRKKFRKAIIIAPPSADNSYWMKRFEPFVTALVSGWMINGGSKSWLKADKGFALSDHADWKGLNEAVLATGAEKVIVTHGYINEFADHLNNIGIEAEAIPTQFDTNAS